MSMAIRFGFIISIILLIQSCAQVQTLSGGETDTTAPQIIPEKSNPQNGATNYHENHFELTFDEYITLVNPNETMIMVPPHAKPKVKLKKKTLQVSWEDSLSANTTYAFYFNGTIKDINEGNDSLYSFVFSTGELIDSLSYQVKVVDAYTNSPSSNTLVGLYFDSSEIRTNRPLYFAKTDKAGIAQFHYLKAGVYYVFAFEDGNKDLIYQKQESLAFKDEPIVITDSYTDTVPLRISKAKLEPKITSFTLDYPGLLKVGTNMDLSQANYKINGQSISSKDYLMVKSDSILFNLNLLQLDSIQFELTLNDSTYSKTKQLRTASKKAVLTSVVETNIKNIIVPQDSIKIKFSDFILKTDSSKMKLFITTDSTEITFDSYFHHNELILIPKINNTATIQLKLQPQAVTTQAGFTNDTITQVLDFKSNLDLGILTVTSAQNQDNMKLYVFQNGITVLSKDFDTNQTLVLENLLPGEYQFGILIDQNQNGVWDVFNYKTKQQPERMLWYNEKVKVRANWEVKTSLE
jgi:hypothetical protein